MITDEQLNDLIVQSQAEIQSQVGEVSDETLLILIAVSGVFLKTFHSLCLKLDPYVRLREISAGLQRIGEAARVQKDEDEKRKTGGS